MTVFKSKVFLKFLITSWVSSFDPLSTITNSEEAGYCSLVRLRSDSASCEARLRVQIISDTCISRSHFDVFAANVLAKAKLAQLGMEASI